MTPVTLDKIENQLTPLLKRGNLIVTGYMEGRAITAAIMTVTVDGQLFTKPYNVTPGVSEDHICTVLREQLKKLGLLKDEP